MSTLTTLGLRIRDRRKGLALSQKELAERSKLAQTTISKLERGDIVQLSSANLASVASALLTSVDFLLGETDDFRSGNFVEGDHLLAYLMELYRGMTREQVRPLLQYAEFLYYRPETVKHLTKTLVDLHQYSRDAVKSGSWDERDARLLRADEVVAGIAIDRALKEAERKAKDEQAG